MLLLLISSTLAWKPFDCFKKPKTLPISPPISSISPPTHLTPNTLICEHKMVNNYWEHRGPIKDYEDRTSSLVFTHDAETFTLNALFDGHGILF